jgi:MYXO-CTERM domain-containing protein
MGAGGARVRYVVNPRGPAAPASFESTVTLRERKIYYAPIRNGEASNFLGATVDSKGVAQTLKLGAVAYPASSVLSLSLQGVTSGSHAVLVSVGGVPVGTCAFMGLELATCDFDLPFIAEGATSVVLTATGPMPDLSLVESLALTYDHAFVAEDDRLAFTVPAKRRVEVAGFSTPDVRVLDVTDPRVPIELVTSPSMSLGAPAPGTWTIAFDVQDGETSRSIVAFAAAKVLAPASVTAHRPSDWMRPRDGELVILAHASFMDAARALADRRAADGWSVALVDVQDAYDELGAGDKSAVAIRDFLRGAAARWTTPPRHVLLVGDATFDPRNFLGRGDLDFVPTALVDAADMETSSDDWFADTDDDGWPDLAIGRLPVHTAAEAKAVVDKILAYGGKDELRRGGLFVTDMPADELDFEAASAASASTVADIMPVETYKRAAGAAGLLAKLRTGPFLVNYFGHGSVEVWEGLLAGADVAGLDNQHLSVYVAMNCLNGFFQDLYTTSLAERLLLAPGGAVAVWASSTLTAFDPQTTMNKAFLSRLSRTSLGQAALEAKRTIDDRDTRRTWILFGDPTLFGTPGPWPTPDAGADAGTEPEAGTPDADAPEAGAPDADVVSPDADVTDAGTDAVSVPDAKSDAPDADKPVTSAGCSCRTASTADHASWLVSLLLAVAFASRRRRNAMTP